MATRSLHHGLNDPQPGTAPAQAIELLADRYGPRLYNLGLRLCGNHADAQDLVQDVFLQAFRRWSTFRGNSSAGTWLHAIAARACSARARRRGGTDRRMPALSQVMPWRDRVVADVVRTATTGVTPSHQAVERSILAESIESVHESMRRLPEHFRVPLLLKDVLELSVDETAEALGIKPQTVKTRVHRARLMLRAAIMSRVPTRPAPAPTYEKQVCVDLLKAKLNAMDNGRGFPIGREVLCDRCRSVFAELDLTQLACAHLSDGAMPDSVRRAIRSVIARAERAAYKPRSSVAAATRSGRTRFAAQASRRAPRRRPRARR